MPSGRTRPTRQCHLSRVRVGAQGRGRALPGVRLPRNPAWLSQRLDTALRQSRGGVVLDAYARALQEASGLTARVTQVCAGERGSLRTAPAPRSRQLVTVRVSPGFITVTSTLGVICAIAPRNSS